VRSPGIFKIMRTIQQIKQDRDLLFTLIRVYKEAIADPDVFKDLYQTQRGLCRAITAYTYIKHLYLVGRALHFIKHGYIFPIPIDIEKGDHTTLRNSFEVRLELLYDLLRENREEEDELEGDE
jgi:hypothetical protein